MDFSKRWILASLIFHAILLIALSFIDISLSPSENIRRFTVEIIDYPVETIQEPTFPIADDIRNPIQNEIENSPDTQVTPDVPERTDVLGYFVIPDDIMFVKREVDSIKIEIDRLRKYYSENRIVPFRSRLLELLDMKPITNVPDVPPEKHLSLRDSLQNIVSNSKLLQFNIDDYAPLNDIVAQEYYSKYSNPTLPVIPLIMQGISLAGKVFSKIFSVDSPKEINRFLTLNEIRLMKVVWKQKEIVPSELYAQLPADIPLSMDDVISHLEQLHLKGILEKRQRSNEELFFPLITRKDLFAFYLAAYTESMQKSKEYEINGSAGELLSGLKDKLLLLSSDNIKHYN